MIHERRKASIPSRIISGLFVMALTMIWTSRASGITFEKAINPNSSYLEDVQQTSDGGYVVGATLSTAAYIVLVAKFDSSGNFQWRKQYQLSGGASQVYALKQTSDGGYVWAGELQNSSGTDYALVVKLDSSGNIQWQQTYGVAAYATDIRQTTDGGYIVGGVTPGNVRMVVSGWLAKLDSSGNVQWQETLSGSSPSQSVMTNAVIQTTDGGYTLTGLANVNVLAAHFDSSGNVKWQTTYTSPSSYGIGYAIVQTSDGGYMVGGYDNISPYLGLALKLDSSGKVKWAKTYDISGATSKFFSTRQTTDGGYAFAGQFITGIGYYYGYNSWLVKTDSSGNTQWQKAYGNTNYAASFQKVNLTSDGGFVAGGYTLEYNYQNEAYIVKTDSSGSVKSCKDAQVTSGTTASLSESASGAKLIISTPTNVASSGTVSESSTSFTLTTECSGS